MEKLTASFDTKIQALRKNSYFSTLEESALGELVDGVALRRYSEGEILFWQGEAGRGLHILQSGRVKLFKLSGRGRELIIRILAAGETFNEVPVFDCGLTAVNVAALEACEVWVVEADTIARAMRRHPEMSHAVILTLTQTLRVMVEKIEELTFYQVPNRLARLILNLNAEQLNGPAEKRLTQDQMAARLGTVREVVARGLRELQSSGAIRVRRGRIQIIDRALLEAWAQDVLTD